MKNDSGKIFFRQIFESDKTPDAGVEGFEASLAVW